jgi:dynein heavy chain
MSVSQKFLGEQESVPKDVTNSIGEFMAYVHNSSTEISKNYLANDKRYNYTTPKSFLELINLYIKILSEKHSEFQGKIERLGSGLDKLKATGVMVDKLKEQLAGQEVELAKKNAEADHLINVVGIETQNVSQEKTSADEEKLKVDQINIDVRAKQIDCEHDLKKAEPALLAAQDALNTLNKVSISSNQKYAFPHHM